MCDEEGWDVHVGFIHSHFILVTIISPEGEVECKRIDPALLGYVPSGEEIRQQEYSLIRQKMNNPPRVNV